MPPAPAVSSRCRSQPSVSASASLITSPARRIALGTSPFFAEPGWRTTPTAPIPRPTRSDWISEVSDFERISSSSEAQFSRYTAWISTASIGLLSRASRKAAKSSSPYAVGRHIRGDWLKI